MHNQRGGLKLIKQGTTHLDALIRMLLSPGAVISILSENSLRGFILIFSVEEGNAEYYMQNMDGSFTMPATSYILKLAITNPSDIYLAPYASSIKMTESKTSFYNEVLLQQNVWIKSITGNRPPVCPSIGSFFLFNNNNAKNCLNFFKSLSEHELRCYSNGTINGNAFTTLGRRMTLEQMANNKRQLFIYLLSQISSPHRLNTGLGIILMQNVPNCETLQTFLLQNISRSSGSYSLAGALLADPVAKTMFVHSISLLISQIVRLFIEIGVIHFDLHENNELYGGLGAFKKWLLIDFGLASDILIKVDDFYLNVGEKNDIERKKEEYLRNFFSLSFNSSSDINNRSSRKRGLVARPEEKRQFISEVMEYLSNIDREKLKEKYYVIPAQENATEAAAEAAASPGNPAAAAAAARAAGAAAAAEAAPAVNYQMMWYEKIKALPAPVFDDILENVFEQLKEIIIVNIDSARSMSLQTLDSYKSQGIIFGSEGKSPDDYLFEFPPIACAASSGAGCIISGGKRNKKTRKQRKRKNKKNKNYNKTIKCAKKKKKYQNVFL